ncbi:hotdog fold thioesterase [Woodsholea maritima]|uniref:hotdog fold thioesterase n=1 Tax=Woodsholea maritima TaxID=240237 RepID=UPI0003774923|nr:hotdog fold thioesterase [Woodsholea maritima]
MNDIWRVRPSLEALNAGTDKTILKQLGIEIIELGPDYVKGRMPVDARTHQPYGLLHGGANVVLSESLGGVGSNLLVDTNEWVCVGQEINANHVRSVASGWVIGTARPLHIGRTSQVWQTEIHDEAQRLICVSRLTVAVVPLKAPGA